MSERVILDNRLGIGTVVPQAPLHIVAGDIDVRIYPGEGTQVQVLGQEPYVFSDGVWSPAGPCTAAEGFNDSAAEKE